MGQAADRRNQERKTKQGGIYANAKAFSTNAGSIQSVYLVNHRREVRLSGDTDTHRVIVNFEGLTALLIEA